MIHRVYYYFNYISIIISVTISCYSSSLPTHITRVTLDRCTGDFTCRFLCLDAARDVGIGGGLGGGIGGLVKFEYGEWQSRDSERLCNVTEHR